MENLKNINVIITAGGLSQRFGVTNKLFAPCGASYVITEAIKPFLTFGEVKKVIVAIDPSFSDEFLELLSREKMDSDTRISLTIGGNSRTNTVKNGLSALTNECDLVLIHDGARPFVSHELIANVIATTKVYGASFPALDMTDSIVEMNGDYASDIVNQIGNISLINGVNPTANIIDKCSATATNSGYSTVDVVNKIDENAATNSINVDNQISDNNANIIGLPQPVLRERFKRVQTPFGCARAQIVAAYAAIKGDETDDYSVLHANGGHATCVEGDKNNIKITYKSDLHTQLVGCGYDIHRLVSGDGIKLNGIYIPCPFSFVAHSDGDVPVHAIMDAILSALGERDIGHFFPVDDAKYDNANSLTLLESVLDIMRQKNYKIANVTVTIIAEKPHIAPLIDKMRACLSPILDVSPNRIGIAATSNEQVGTIGDGNAIAAYASVLLSPLD